MVKYLLLPVSVAFSVSFGLGLLVYRDGQKALLTGLISVPATFSGVVAVNRKQLTRQKLALNVLQRQICKLESWENQLHDSLSTMAVEKQRTEVNLNSLREELNQLRFQAAEQRRYNQQISQDLIALGEQKYQMEAEAQRWQTQIYSLEQRRGEIDLSLRSIKAKKHKAEASLKAEPIELQQLQVHISVLQKQKEELEQDLTLLERLKPQQQEKSYNLQTQIQELENTQADLNQSLVAIAATKQQTELSLDSLRSELTQLQAQVIAQQNTKEKLEQELISLHQQKYSLEADEKPTENLPDEWSNFMMRLPKYELQVLKALVDPGSPSAKIKKIAEENITMPELLIDLLNDRALNTIGDIIIESGQGSAPPQITEEYLPNVRKVIERREVN